MPRLRSPAELLGRLAQAGFIAGERVGLVRGNSTAASLQNAVPRLPFPKLGPSELHAIYEQRPAERNALFGHAEALHRGRFSLLGYRDLEFGDPVAWNYDPIRGKRAPYAHWSRVPYLDSERVGDHKLIWELNRHQWMVSLAQAWALTGDQQHLDRLAGSLEDWLRLNPPKSGINWASSLELAFRTIAWTWVLHIAPPGFLGPARWARVCESLELQGRHIERFLSRWFSPNTHLTGEALGLLYLGTAWPELPRAAAWREKGWAILREYLPRHLREDGTYFEQATWYLAYTLDFYLHAIPLAEQAGWSLDESELARIGSGLTALGRFRREDGRIALWGDDDGGRLLPLSPGAHDRFDDTLGLGAALLKGPPAVPAAQIPASVAWIVGAGAWQRLTRDAPPPAPRRSGALRQGGWYFLAAGKRGLLSIDAGPHGVPPRHGHAHADALALDLVAEGLPVLIDSGTFSYIGAERDRFRASGAHNSMTLGELGSAEPGGPFDWRSAPATRVETWRAGDAWDLLVASHDGFARRWPGLMHQRTALRWGERGWVIIDRLEGGIVDADGTLAFHVAPGLSPRRSEQEAVVIERGAGEAVARLVTDGAGELLVEPREISRCYGAQESGTVVLRRLRPESLLAGVATCLLLGQDVSVFRRLESDGGICWAWDTPEGVVRLLLRAPGAARIRAGDWECTARFAMVVPTAEGLGVAVFRIGPGAITRSGAALISEDISGGGENP